MNEYNDVYAWDDDVYMVGHGDGKRAERRRVAEAMTTARRNETEPAALAALDKLAKSLGLTVKTEVSYTA